MSLVIDIPWERTSGTVITLSSQVNITLNDDPAVIGPATLDLAVSGWGGIDITPAKPWKMYFIFAVMDDDTVKLVASIHGKTVGLLGTCVGFFSTDATSAIQSVSSNIAGMTGEQRKTKLSEADFFARLGPGWTLCDGKLVVGSQYAKQHNTTRVPNIPLDADGKRTYIKVT